MHLPGGSILLFGFVLVTSSSLADAAHLARHRHVHYRRQELPVSTPIPRLEDINDAEERLSTLVASFDNLLAQVKALLLDRRAQAAPLISGDVTTTLKTTIFQTVTVTSIIQLSSPIQTSSATTPVSNENVPSPATPAFNPAASTNIAVYYGSDPGTSVQGLAALCLHPRISIINIAFVADFFSGGGFPRTAFGPACDLPPNQFVQQRAPDLQNCTTLGKQITTCQKQYGKKIFVSLGGYGGNSAFSSTAQAQQFATNLWHLFGGSTATPYIRPFGRDVVVDGFDIDNEDHSTAYYTDFAMALKSLYAQDPSRKYYLSAAPQCIRPDASIPTSVLRMCDFVHVQFYNNPSCNLDSSGFASSVAGWSAALTVPGQSTPRLLVGIPAWPGAGSGYVPGPNLSSIIPSASVMKSRYPNFGGLMSWAGAEAVSNIDSQGLTFLQRMAAILPP